VAELAIQIGDSEVPAARRRWQAEPRVIDGLRGVALALVVLLTLVVTPRLGAGNEAYTTGKLLILSGLAAVSAFTLAPIQKVRVSLAGWLLGAYGAHGVISAAAGTQTLTMCSVALLPELSAGLVLAAVAAGTRNDAARRALVLDVIVVGATLMSLIALGEALGIQLPWSGARRPHSTLGNRNFVGAEAAIAAVIAYGRFVHRPSRARGLAIVILVAAVGLSRCRSAWLGSLVAVAVTVAALAVWHRRWRRDRAGLAAVPVRRAGVAAALSAVALSAVAFAPWPGLRWTDTNSPMGDTLGRITEYKTGTGRERLADFAVAATIASEHPLLGVGPRGWDNAASAHAHQIAERHATPQHFWSTPNSDLARTLAERGVVGLSLLLAAAVALIEGALRRARSRPLYETVTLLAALAALAVNAALDAPLFRPSSLVLAALLLGLAGNWHGARRMRPPRLAWLGSLLLTAALIVAGTGLRVAAAATIASDPDGISAMERAQSLFWRPDVAEVLSLRLARAGHCSEAEAVGVEAMRATPNHWGVAHGLAGCWHARGQFAAAARFARARDSIEPHVELLFRSDADVASGYERHP
jgi:O-Antigen ligase